MPSGENSALLVMDVQGAIVKSLGRRLDNYLINVNHAISAARKFRIPVFFIIVRFREGYPELHPRSSMYKRLHSGQSYKLSGKSADTEPVIVPQKEDMVVVKKRVSAFAGSDLEVLLKAREITKLILCGIATSGVVLSTLRQAADMDYEISVLSDCCSDRDEEVHRVLMEKVFPGQASILTAADWARDLS